MPFNGIDNCTVVSDTLPLVACGQTKQNGRRKKQKSKKLKVLALQ
jgi:hypothetical protein